ncbi:MAG: metal-dependent transcriptional regulator [Candidatus Thorarchaeota archaeon]
MKSLNKSYEDYIKAIYLISKENKGGWASNSKISNLLKVKPSSVTNMLYKLKANDLIDWKPKKSLRLTKKGKKIALSIINNYNRLFDFFIHVLKLKDKNQVQNLCCKIEHYITPEISDALENLILEFH